MPLNTRVFVCRGCPNIECRDVNASCSILEAGRRLRSGDTRKISQEASVAVRKHITAESHRLEPWECVNDQVFCGEVSGEFAAIHTR
jgi:transposase